MTETTKISLGDSPVLKPRPADLVLVAEPVVTQPSTAPLVDDPAARVAAALGKTPPRSAEAKPPSLNPLLDQLVYGDNDIVGLVAYAMHEVHRRDWCAAFESVHGRTPSQVELNVFLVGERIERRLDTYRRLAEDALAKVAQGDTNLRRLNEAAADPAKAPAPAGAPLTAKPQPVAAAKPAVGLASLNATASDKLAPPVKTPGNLGKLAVYLLLLLVAVAALGYLMRFGIDATQPVR